MRRLQSIPDPCFLAAIPILASLVLSSCSPAGPSETGIEKKPEPQFVAARQPVYQDRKLSEWLEDFDTGQSTQTWNHASMAVRNMGTNTLPFLVAWIQFEGSPFRSGTNFPNSRRPLEGVFGALGPIAKPAIPELIGLLNNQKDRVRGEAAFALGLIGEEPDVTVPPLITLLESSGFPDNFMSRAMAVYSLGMFGAEAKSAMPILMEMLFDPDLDDVHGALRTSVAYYGLRNIAPKEFVEALIEKMKDPDPWVRGNAIGSMHHFGDEWRPAMAMLLEAQKDTDSRVRESATMMLKHLNSADSVGEGEK